MTKLRVWGGLSVGPQKRTIVAARSKAEAVRLLNMAGVHMTIGEFNGYWAETGNTVEVGLAKRLGVWQNQALNPYTEKARWEKLADWNPEELP